MNSVLQYDVKGLISPIDIADFRNLKRCATTSANVQEKQHV